MEPTEMAGVAEAETQAAYAWALDDGVDDLPTQRLTPRRVTALALAVSLVLIAVAGAVALWTHRQPGPAHVAAAPPAAAPTVAPAVVLPDEPPPNSGCSGAVIGHSDAKHPQLGMVRVFLFFRRIAVYWATLCWVRPAGHSHRKGVASNWSRCVRRQWVRLCQPRH